VAIVGFDPSVLMNYYFAKLPLGGSQVPNSPLSQQSQVTPPWAFGIKKPSQEAQDVSARSSDPYFDPKDKTLTSGANSSGANAGSELEAIVSKALSQSNLSSGAQSQNPGMAADNDKLFALYNALSRLDYITQMAQRDGTVAGQLPGLNNSFQDGLNQILSFVKSTSFNGLSLLPGQKNASVISTAAVPYPKSYYTGAPAVGDADVLSPLANVGAADSFTIAVTKAGVTTNVTIDLSRVQGGLTMDNIDAYVNSQLAAAGFASKFARVQTGGSLLDGTATWGIQVQNSPSEKIALSSAGAAPAVYVAGSSGLSANSQGKLVKLVDLDGAPTAEFSAAITPDTGTAQAKSVATDANGNVYVVGNATGSFGNEVNQGAQDVFLTKYDSAGNVQWTKLLGSADTASGYSVAIDPTGGVVVAGSVTGELTPTSIGGGTDSFVAKYNSEGDQVWLRQTAPLSNDQANAVSVDASGNVYVGGQVAGTIAGGTSAGGADAYVTKLDHTGKVVYQRQFGSAADDTAARTAIAADGNLVVASVENGHAILTKYSAADGTSAALWRMDLGSLNGGAIGGLTINNGKIYVSGTTSNGTLDAGGAAAIANAATGGTDAFVFAASDSGASASADFVSYVGTGSDEKGGGVTVANGEIYLAGTTSGTFPGETRNAQGTHNLFVAQLAADGTLNWTRQYGGLDGESQGLAIAADPTGSSVLDALGLQRGLIDENQSSAIASQTTVRPGDYFSLQITDKSGTHTAKITIGNGETMRSLAIKINGALLFNGKAQAYPIKGGQGLKISVNPGVQVQLLAGPKDFDALAGLGLKPQLLVNDVSTNPPAKGSSTSAASGNTTASNATAATGPQTIGLGLNVGLDVLNKTTAAHAHVVISAAQSLIKQAYNKLNGTGQTTQAATGPVPGYLQSQLANYQTALDWLNAGGGTVS
jgi:hypothetical protein